MSREIKFRAKVNKQDGKWVSGHYTAGNIDYHYITNPDGSVWQIDEKTITEFTGLLDKNGKEIYEGDIITWMQPYRTTQTHIGDNIPNGSYTEPMEPGIRHFQAIVEFKEGCFTAIDEDKPNINPSPLCWAINYWDLEQIKDCISYGRPDAFIFDDPEEGDLQYLMEESKCETVQALIDLLSGVEIRGNIYENPELL